VSAVEKIINILKGGKAGGINVLLKDYIRWTIKWKSGENRKPHLWSDTTFGKGEALKSGGKGRRQGGVEK